MISQHLYYCQCTVQMCCIWLSKGLQHSCTEQALKAQSSFLVCEYPVDWFKWGSCRTLGRVGASVPAQNSEWKWEYGLSSFFTSVPLPIASHPTVPLFLCPGVLVGHCGTHKHSPGEDLSPVGRGLSSTVMSQPVSARATWRLEGGWGGRHSCGKQNFLLAVVGASRASTFWCGVGE